MLLFFEIVLGVEFIVRKVFWFVYIILIEKLCFLEMICDNYFNLWKYNILLCKYILDWKSKLEINLISKIDNKYILLY